jgi:hypothetical protein
MGWAFGQLARGLAKQGSERSNQRSEPSRRPRPRRALARGRSRLARTALAIFAALEAASLV